MKQLRSKFKKLVSECKKIALTIKTASGVQNFLRERGYGATFNQLYAIVKTRDSCNPEKAVEPSAPSASNAGSDDETEIFDGAQEKEEKQFVPVRNRKRRHKDDTLSEAVHLIRGVIENDPTRDLIKLIRDDMEKSRQHEVRLMEMLLESGNQQKPVDQQGPPPFTQHSLQGYPGLYQGYHGYQEYQGYQFRPLSPATVFLTPPATSSRSSRCSPSTDSSISDGPVYQSL